MSHTTLEKIASETEKQAAQTQGSTQSGSQKRKCDNIFRVKIKTQKSLSEEVQVVGASDPAISKPTDSTPSSKVASASTMHIGSSWSGTGVEEVQSQGGMVSHPANKHCPNWDISVNDQSSNNMTALKMLLGLPIPADARVASSSSDSEVASQFVTGLMSVSVLLLQYIELIVL